MGWEHASDVIVPYWSIVVKTKLRSVEKVLIRDLALAKNGLNAYTLFRRYTIRPAQLSNAIRTFEELGYVNFDGWRLEMTGKGREWLIKSGLGILETGETPWREIPQEFVQPRIPKDKPFTPTITMVDDELLPAKWIALKRNLRIR